MMIYIARILVISIFTMSCGSTDEKKDPNAITGENESGSMSSEDPPEKKSEVIGNPSPDSPSCPVMPDDMGETKFLLEIDGNSFTLESESYANQLTADGTLFKLSARDSNVRGPDQVILMIRIFVNAEGKVISPQVELHWKRQFFSNFVLDGKNYDYTATEVQVTAHSDSNVEGNFSATVRAEKDELAISGTFQARATCFKWHNDTLGMR